MELNMKSVALILLLLTVTASVGQGQEIDTQEVDEEVQRVEIDKRAVDEATCAWNAVKPHLPSSTSGTVCKAVGDAVTAVANVPCVKNAVDSTLNSLLGNIKNYVNGCSLTLSELKDYISNDGFCAKAHVPTVLLIAIGGMLATRRYIL